MLAALTVSSDDSCLDIAIDAYFYQLHLLDDR
jgi:hypothetical protein